jgi:hypothetical protein
LSWVLPTKPCPTLRFYASKSGFAPLSPQTKFVKKDE